MRHTASAHSARLAAALQAGGIQPARALSRSLGFSQPTLSRAMAHMGPAIERVGAARSALYGLRRDVRGHGSTWPIYRISPEGRALRAGQLRALHGGFRLLPEGAAPGWLARQGPTGVFGELPFVLRDTQPRGYLGRAVALRRAQGLAAPQDPRAWVDDDLVDFLVAEGHDLPGNLVLGDRALERALRRGAAVGDSALSEADRPASYLQRAEAAEQGDAAEGSVGGEHPKFLAEVARTGGRLASVIVKFSSAVDSSVRQRWADLLLCEDLAARVLGFHGVPGARTQVLDAGGRRFLEVERFDRFEGVGRRGTVTLGAIEEAFAGGRSPDGRWETAAARLQSEGLLSPEAARQLRWRGCFGDMIANVGMHRANANLWLGDAPRFELAPSYGMAPLLFAPGPQGDLGARPFSPRPPLPAVEDVWAGAARAASDFWDRVADDERASPGFRALARGAAGTLSGLVARFG